MTPFSVASILLPLGSTIFIVAFYGSDHSGVDGKKDKLNAISQADYNVPSYLGKFNFFANFNAWDEYSAD